MKLLKIVSIFLCVCLLGGCGDSDNGFGQTNPGDGSMTGMEGNAPELSYEVIPQVPNVLVDQVGYKSLSEKIAIFRGDNLAETFDIIDSQTEEVVYTGKIVGKLYNEELEEYISYGTFTEFETEGNYYIQTAIIGQSYPFSIGNNIYYDIFTTTCKGFYKSLPSRKGQTYSENSVMEDSKVIANLLLAYVLYPDLFGDDLEIPESDNGIPDILDTIKYDTDWFLTIQIDKMSGDDLASYAGILAKFSQIYKLYDNSYSRECLKAAEAAYQMLDSAEVVNDSLQYFAAVELYMATSYNKYHIVVKEYINKERVINNDVCFELYGNIGYLSGKMSIDTVLCGEIIEKLMNRAEKISESSSDNPYLVCCNQEDEILDEMQYLAIVDYVITNHEYVTVQENHLHYLLGRNPQGISYISEEGYMSMGENIFSIPEQSSLNAKLIFMVSEILESEKVE